MLLESKNINDYLKFTEVIDGDNPAIIAKAREIIDGIENKTEQAKALFEWVRDEIPHSQDIQSNVVTCAASQVLLAGTGICYAKSHLLAAMLRVASIPAGFCYQVLTSDPPYNSMVLHGLNGIYLEDLERWIRVDSRGNTGDIDAQFSIYEEKLAFYIDEQKGEFTYETIFVNPVPTVIRILNRYKNCTEMCENLPASI